MILTHHVIIDVDGGTMSPSTLPITRGYVHNLEFSFVSEGQRVSLDPLNDSITLHLGHTRTPQTDGIFTAPPSSFIINEEQKTYTTTVDAVNTTLGLLNITTLRAVINIIYNGTPIIINTHGAFLGCSTLNPQHQITRHDCPEWPQFFRNWINNSFTFQNLADKPSFITTVEAVTEPILTTNTLAELLAVDVGLLVDGAITRTRRLATESEGGGGDYVYRATEPTASQAFYFESTHTSGNYFLRIN